MTVRWRLVTLLVQLCVLVGATYLAEGRPYSAGAWFTSGILAVVVNRQLWEPFFSRPADVLGNSIIAGVFTLTVSKTQATLGWKVLGGFLVFFGITAATALLFGAGRSGTLSGLGRFAAIICRVASGRIIYSAVFVLSLLETTQSLSENFWLLLGAWLVALIIGAVNWQAAFAAATGRPGPSEPVNENETVGFGI